MAIIRVGELISGRLIYIDSEDNVIKAAILMRENDISSLLVKHKGDFVSIVTEKDIINKVVAEELYPGDVKVSEIMSKDLFTVSKNESIEEAAKLMRKKGVRRLVVLEDERIVGIITETDIAKHLKAIVGGAP
ncbi:CBS domain-containing protein [Candidatus Methanoperedens nitratireducens]|uniref:Putative signal transduction protein n=1 Tax=Candidatus Methanoperedens nitratireducens TaxID=1392998 RepID=A0A284VNE3_9EURY